VVEEGATSRDFGGRAPIPYAVSTVHVTRVFKGTLTEEYITIGQSGDPGDPMVAIGFEGIFFLEDDRDNDWQEGTVLWDFHPISGPQGKFAVHEDRVRPLGSPRWETTKRYDAMPVDEFISEVEMLIQASDQ
jgi:hypothetical protein